MKLKSQKALLLGKQKSISYSDGAPSSAEGGEGAMTVRWIPNRGLHLMYKWGTKWYSTKLNLRMHRNIDPPLKIPNKTPIKTGEIGFSEGKVKVK